MNTHEELWVLPLMMVIYHARHDIPAIVADITEAVAKVKEAMPSHRWKGVGLAVGVCVLACAIRIIPMVYYGSGGMIA